MEGSRDPDEAPSGGHPPDPHRMPRWVLGFVVVGVVVAALVVLVLMFGGGEHGPSRHLPGGETSAGAPEGGIAPPGERP